MKKLLFIITIISLLCTSCFPHRPENFYGGSEGMKNRDYMDCLYEAEKATASLDNPLIMWTNQRELVKRCMRMKGYYLK